MKIPESEIQKEYYSRTAEVYDQLHLEGGGDREHNLALTFLSSMIEAYSINSVLDIGAGTGRTISYLQNKFPHLKIVGIEPVEALRKIGYEKGISRDVLIDGDGTNVAFAAESFDLVCEFAVLHHVPRPHEVVSEMLRVAKKAVFISDSNNFGQGTTIVRGIKQLLNALKLWRIYDLIRTKGKGYQISEGDGLFYSYSVFNNYEQLENACTNIHILNTGPSPSINHYRSASQIALIGIK